MFHLRENKYNQLQNIFTKSLIETIQYINSTPRDQNGVWYYDDYAQYCHEKNIEFNSDLELGFANPEYWERTGRCAFKLKTGKKPSEAISAFVNGFTIADCGNILIACQYVALLTVFGEEKFDSLFNSKCSPLVINQFIYDQQLDNPASYFFDVSGNSKKNIGNIGHRPVDAGEFCNIKGVIFHPHKHPASCVSSFNVVCIGKNENGEDTFLGFGPNTFTKPLTERELFDVFVYHYNLDRNEFDEKVSKNTKTFFIEKISIDDHYDMIEGFLPASVVRPNFQVISQYISLHASEVAIYFCNAMAKIYSKIDNLEHLKENMLQSSKRKVSNKKLLVTSGRDEYISRSTRTEIKHVKDSNLSKKNVGFFVPSDNAETNAVPIELQDAINDSRMLKDFVKKKYVTLLNLVELHQNKPWVVNALRCSNIYNGICDSYITIEQLSRLTQEQITLIVHIFKDAELQSIVEHNIRLLEKTP